MAKKKDTGKIGWIDLTVDKGEEIKDFYCQVTGWESSAVSLGDYDDYCVAPPANADGSPNDPVAGICHKRGDNSNVPSQWLMYVNVDDIDQSMSDCERLGGQIVTPKRDMGSYGHMCVIQDPAGAMIALMEPPE